MLIEFLKNLFTKEEQDNVPPVVEDVPIIKEIDNSISNYEQTGEKFEPKERDSYIFQIGFDFGTSNSKIIIRDIVKDRAWAYFGANQNFLIPSSVVFEKGTFKRNYSLESFYPPFGLYHLKMALSKVARGEQNASILKEYKTILGESFHISESVLVNLASIYFIASCLSDVIESIVKAFPDYGNNNEDIIAVNLAIPVSDIEESDAGNHFENILNIAWKIANISSSTLGEISIEDLQTLVNTALEEIERYGKDDLCHVYPEVSANIQAFIKSPASSPDERTIYFFSDIGAGTVDQCIFTYAGESKEKGENRKIHYFAAKISLVGSGVIEEMAKRNSTIQESLEYWRELKERGSSDSAIIEAKEYVSHCLGYDVCVTLKAAEKCLFSVHTTEHAQGPMFQTDPKHTLKNKTTFIFGGGGFTINPYKDTTLERFKNYVSTTKNPITTSIDCPNDIIDWNENFDWKRLYVAYGLSFQYDELTEFTFPSFNKLSRKEITMKELNCTCCGINKVCSRCGGTGKYSV